MDGFRLPAGRSTPSPVARTRPARYPGGVSQPTPRPTGAADPDAAAAPLPEVPLAHAAQSDVVLPPRVLGDLTPRDGLAPGAPVLVCLGGVHGNEPAGVTAISRVVSALESDGRGLAGRFLGLSGNRQALARGQRYLERDLNRAFVAERMTALMAVDGPHEAEDREVVDLARRLQQIIREAEGPVFLLDIHTTSSGGAAFAILDDVLDNRSFAFTMPVPHVLGLEEEIAGTITSWANLRGVVCAAVEAGQHEDPVSANRAESAVWIALEAAGVLTEGARREPAGSRRYLRAESVGLPRVVEVRYRHALEAGHRFAMRPGYRNFHPVEAGELLATDGDDPVTLDHDAMLLMPLYQGQGDDGFFVVHQVNPAWLRVSAGLRRLHLHRFLKLLPGVTPHPDNPEELVVDLRRAKWFALEVFHLLGYRRVLRDEHTLVMIRRERL